MTVLQAFVLGLVQGLTEFLPVSSSAHLVILQYFFGLKGPILLIFDVVVHLGTLSAILIYFRKILFPFPKISGRTILLILFATIPTAVIGFAFKNHAEMLFGTLKPVSIALLINSAILWSTKWIRTQSVPLPLRDRFYFKSTEQNLSQPEGVPGLQINWWNAFWIGVIQGIAVTPGISRSGSTITAAMWFKIKPEEAARFSFLLAVPAILGATVLIVPDALSSIEQAMWPALIVGFVSALISGYAAIVFLFRILQKGRFHYFALYTLILSLAAFLFAWFY